MGNELILSGCVTGSSTGSMLSFTTVTDVNSIADKNEKIQSEVFKNLKYPQNYTSVI